MSFETQNLVIEPQGNYMAASAPMVSHLLFADDSLLFFKANRENADQAKDVLHVYCQASRQLII